MFKRVLTAIFILIIFVGCNSKVPYTNRNQLILISKAQELNLGEKSYENALKNAKVINNTINARKVKDIGRRIARVTNRKDYKWEFNLVEKDEANAFCLPGGKVVVYTGIFKFAKNDDQLATVISHEIGHALARHGAERMTTNLISEGVQMVGNVVLSTQSSGSLAAFNVAYGLGSQYGILLPYSRVQENEADEIGIHLMAKAGFRMHEALKFWKNMSKNSKGGTDFFSTHPSSEKRIKHIAEVIKEIESHEGIIPEKNFSYEEQNKFLGEKLH